MQVLKTVLLDWKPVGQLFVETKIVLWTLINMWIAILKMAHYVSVVFSFLLRMHVLKRTIMYNSRRTYRGQLVICRRSTPKPKNFMSVFAMLLLGSGWAQSSFSESCSHKMFFFFKESVHTRLSLHCWIVHIYSFSILLEYDFRDVLTSQPQVVLKECLSDFLFAFGGIQCFHGICIFYFCFFMDFNLHWNVLHEKLVDWNIAWNFFLLVYC